MIEIESPNLFSKTTKKFQSPEPNTSNQSPYRESKIQIRLLQSNFTVPCPSPQSKVHFRNPESISRIHYLSPGRRTQTLIQFSYPFPYQNPYQGSTNQNPSEDAETTCRIEKPPPRSKTNSIYVDCI